MKQEHQDVRLTGSIGMVLRYGVLLSSIMLGVGLLLMQAAPPNGGPDTLQSAISSNFGRPTLSPSELISGLAVASPLSILTMGMLVLIATPFARVIASVVLFAKEGDLLYVGITLLVLLMLVVAIVFIGPAAA